MADHKHGEMNITDQEKTFEGFLKWSIRVAMFSIFILILFALFNS